MMITCMKCSVIEWEAHKIKKGLRRRTASQCRNTKFDIDKNLSLKTATQTAVKDYPIPQHVTSRKHHSNS